VKILVLKRDKLGDLLLTTPMFARLREAFPTASIELLASQYNAWVAKGNPNLDRIHAYPRVRTGRSVSIPAALRQVAQFVALRRTRYDWIIVAQGEDSPRAIQRALYLKSDRIIAYAASNRSYGTALTDPMPPPDLGHEAQRLLDLLKPLGVSTALPSTAPTFVLPEEARQQADQWLTAQRLQRNKFVVLGLGARRARKQPTTAQILRWVQHIESRYALKTVFMWTPGASGNPLYPGDDEIAAPVLAAGLKALLPFRGPLQPALGLIWSARTSIFPDSGLMHFASASPGGVLGLFGDTAEFTSKWAPLGPLSMHLCAERVELLSDAQVFKALDQQLEASIA
jgi:ADP-heptose:LPS heptosyltransferase